MLLPSCTTFVGCVLGFEFLFLRLGVGAILLAKKLLKESFFLLRANTLLYSPDSNHQV
ncbi:hypothetical protein WAF17_02620 [Bernardetia sp. ABR2-2B]|uniref:hypothetical protein n=1 Tax=Bernardetia sp. ABR2-2B TaxID=3127472 RepID=UPI0030CA8885